MVNCCTGVVGVEQGAITVFNFTGETGGGAKSADNFMSSSLASTIFNSVPRVSSWRLSKRMRFSTDADWSGWDGGDGALSFFLDLVEDFFSLVPEGSECSCSSKYAVRFSMSSGKRNSEEYLDFTLDCVVDRGMIKGAVEDCGETSTRDAKTNNERPQMTFGTSGDQVDPGET